jgi:ribonuclease D
LDWKLIESDQALVDLLDSARGSDAVIVDTEFMRRNTFFPEVAVVQLCFSGGGADGTAWLVDPLCIDNPEPLARLLADPAVTKVLHSASEDLEVFQNWLGVLPRPLFDTQKAAALAGMEFGMGYRALVLELCEEDLPKGETRSDWLQRPLTESQCHYAAQDVIWLLSVYRLLEQRLAELGRIEWVLEDGEAATRSLATASPDYYRRIKNAWKLSSRQLAVLMAVCQWREQTARVKNKPRSWIIDDNACLQLALEQPLSVQQLRSEVEMPPQALRRYGDALVEIVNQQQGLGESELPPRLPPPLNAAQRKQLKALKDKAATIAGDLGVPPQILLASKDFETLLRSDGADAATEPGYWSGWRQQLVVDPLRASMGQTGS